MNPPPPCPQHPYATIRNHRSALHHTSVLYHSSSAGNLIPEQQQQKVDTATVLPSVRPAGNQQWKLPQHPIESSV